MLDSDWPMTEFCSQIFFAKLYNDHRQPISNIAVLVSGLSYDPTVSPLT